MSIETNPTASPRQLVHRYDALAKVTGRAKYSVEYTEPFARKDVAYAFIVQSTIANGTILSMETKTAERAPGVLAVITPFNAPKLAVEPRPTLSCLQNTNVRFNGQPIAVVVATSLPEARYAATLIKTTYQEQAAALDFHGRLDQARWPKGQNGAPGTEPAGNQRGDISAAFAKAAVVLDQTYTTPIQNHNPMEPHATTAWWEGDKVYLYDSTQGISGDRQSVARFFNIPLENVSIQCHYLGGGFGSKGSMWSHVPLCAIAAKFVGRPVRLMLERSQMFGLVGCRPTTVNHIKLGATADGKLLGIEHHVILHTAVLGDFVERASGPSRMLYASASNSASEKLVDMNLGVCTYMRGPGEGPGTATLEIAMDELAEKLNMDPIQLRLLNDAQVDPRNNRPWSSKHLAECYTQAAARFGWSRRNSKPAQVVEGNSYIGYGMATATYPGNRSTADAIVRILPNGRAYVGCGAADLGTGSYTIMAQTCADALGLDPKLVEAHLGESSLPKAPTSGGSQTAATICPAVHNAAVDALHKLAALAVADAQSPLHGLDPTTLRGHDGSLVSADSSKQETFAALIARNGNRPIEGTGSSEPAADRATFTSNSWGAIFAEVAVDRDTQMVKVRKVTATYDIGTLINRTTGISQFYGGIVWSVGFALTEENIVDPIHGRTVNASFGEYHIPVNADIGEIDITVLDIPDTRFNPLGARGIGEIGATGAMAAIANAVYNATGKRVREYPITPDKLMRAQVSAAL